MSLQSLNIKRVQDLVGEYQKGNAEGYLEGCADCFSGSVLGGLIPGGEAIKNLDDFKGLMGKMGEYMEVKKFEPANWRATGNDVLFSVDWEFVWIPTGKEVKTTALVRKVLRDNMICEKYHMIDQAVITELTGAATPVHDHSAVARVQALLGEYQKGNAEGYLAGCADAFSGDIFGGLIPGGEAIKSLDDFKGLMGKMDKYMEVKKFEPVNFRALPNSDMMFQVNWTFTWKETGVEMDHTAMVRKVVKDNQICEKYHLCDAAVVKAVSPRDVISAEESSSVA